MRAVRENAFQSTNKTIDENCPFKSLNENDPYFPSIILEVDFPSKWQKRSPEKESDLEENVKKLTNLMNEAMKTVDEVAYIPSSTIVLNRTNCITVFLAMLPTTVPISFRESEPVLSPTYCTPLSIIIFSEFTRISVIDFNFSALLPYHDLILFHTFLKNVSILPLL